MIKSKLLLMIGLAVVIAGSTGCQNEATGNQDVDTEKVNENKMDVGEMTDEKVEMNDDTKKESHSKRPSPPDSTILEVGDLIIKLNYSSPSVKGRTIWGKLVPYNKVWRTGANEANVFSINKNVKINGSELAAGKYSLFSIPTENSWTVIFNKTYKQWGAFEYEESKDALRVQAETMDAGSMAERLKFTLSSNEGKANLMFHWENLSFTFDIE